MMNVDITNIRLMHTDILVKLKPWGDIHTSGFIIPENPDSDSNQYFTVLAVAPAVTDVKVGEVVLIPWTRVTTPFPVEFGGETLKVGITAVKEVLGVVDLV